MKRQNRVACRGGKPRSPRLRNPCRPAWTVERERDGTASDESPLQLQHGTHATARCRAGHRVVAEVLEHTRDPLTIEVRAGESDDAAVTEIPRGRQDPAMPERNDRL